MAYTYRDFLNECENYNHSKEHYEIMKESAELMLMEQFIENQQFAMENTTTFSEGYLMESVGEDYITEAEEKLGAKAVALVKKICAAIAKTVKNFFKWIKNLFKKSKADKLAGIKLSEEEKAKYVGDVINIMKNLNGNGVQILDKKKHVIPCDDENKDKVIDYLIKSLKNKKLNVQYEKDVVTVEALIDAFNLTSKLETANVESAIALIKKSMSTSLTIDLENVEEKINAIDEEIAKHKLFNSEEIMVGAQLSSVDDELLHALAELNEVLNGIIPATSKLYAGVITAVNSIAALGEKNEADRTADNK